MRERLLDDGCLVLVMLPFVVLVLTLLAAWTIYGVSQLPINWWAACSLWPPGWQCP